MDKFTKLHDLTQEQIDEVSEALWDALSYIEDEDEQLDAHFKGMTSNSLCDLEDTIDIYKLSFMKQDATPIEEVINVNTHKENRKMNIREYVREAMANKVREAIESIDIKEMVEDALYDVFDEDAVRDEMREQVENYANQIDSCDIQEFVEEELYGYDVEDEVRSAYKDKVHEIVRDEMDDVIDDVVEDEINNLTI